MLRSRMVSGNDILDVLRTIPDPEMPISIVDLGLVEDVRIEPNGSEDATGGRARVEILLLPTFIGCPALDMIAGDVRAKVSAAPGVGEVKVNWIFDPPWSVDRITAKGREQLKAHGVTVPEHGSKLPVPAHQAPGAVALRTGTIRCPFCGSTSTWLDSAFGPTRCRVIYYCVACRNSFEHMKKV